MKARLADFVLANREPILREWEAFARTCAPAATTMDVTALRDHANQMLTVIAEDLRTPQGVLDQSEKSKGHAVDPDPTAVSAAQEHGAGRAESGFTVVQMVAEYRALRASVIRLWTKSQGDLGPEDVDDLTRFNEAIDQSLAESVAQFTEDLEQSKEAFLAILGHDLRTPLAAISTSAKFMLEWDKLDEPYRQLTDGIVHSASRTIKMVGDLLDFTRSRLGGIPVTRAEMNMWPVVRRLVAEIIYAYPEADIQVETRGELWGCWDGDRISQALSNLIGNAVEHGIDGGTVKVEAFGDKENVSISVHNHGDVIRRDQLDGIFSPMKKNFDGPNKAWGKGPTGNLGLGLYIAERIVTAHHGRIEIQSDEDDGTTFTIVLPRRSTELPDPTSAN